MEIIKRLITDEEGQGMAEYSLILVLIAIAVIVVLTTVGGKIGEVFTRVSTELNNVV